MKNYGKITRQARGLRNPCATSETKNFEDQCAIRAGISLLDSGIGLNSFKGTYCWHGHGKRHVLRAQELADWLTGQPHLFGLLVKVHSVTQVKGKMGIVSSRISGGQEARAITSISEMEEECRKNQEITAIFPLQRRSGFGDFQRSCCYRPHRDRGVAEPDFLIPTTRTDCGNRRQGVLISDGEVAPASRLGWGGACAGIGFDEKAYRIFHDDEKHRLPF